MYSISNRTSDKVRVITSTGRVTVQPGSRKSFRVVKNTKELRELGCYVYRNGKPMYENMGPKAQNESFSEEELLAPEVVEEKTVEEVEEEDDEPEELEEFNPSRQSKASLEEFTKAELQEMVDEQELEVEGTGAGGNVLKSDLIEALTQ